MVINEEKQTDNMC